MLLWYLVSALKVFFALLEEACFRKWGHVEEFITGWRMVWCS